MLRLSPSHHTTFGQAGQQNRLYIVNQICVAKQKNGSNLQSFQTTSTTGGSYHMDNTISDEWIAGIEREMNAAIATLNEKIKEYGSFNVIANSLARNQLAMRRFQVGRGEEPVAIVTEYLALICLKSPFVPGYRELSDAPSYAEDLYEMEELAAKVVQNHALLHKHKFRQGKPFPTHFEATDYSEAMSLEELLIRNDSFEEHHWDLLEGLYSPFDELAREKLGFTIREAIVLCETIADYYADTIADMIKNARTTANTMYEEAIAYKHRNKLPNNFYPPEHLEFFKQAPDNYLKEHFGRFASTYEMIMLGHPMSFSAAGLASMEPLELPTIEAFLNKLAIGFGEIDPDFSRPEIMHPLKDRPLIHHEGRYLCPSLDLLDYSIDRLFANLLQTEKTDKFKNIRHDYVMREGMNYLKKVLQPTQCHENLKYGIYEMDGFIEVDGNYFFIEGKGHRITDAAKEGYIQRLEKHFKQIVTGAHSQAIRSYEYVADKPAAEFREKSGKKVWIDGSRIKRAFFICLTLEPLRTVASNLKVGSPLGDFDVKRFPWLVCLYDLRVIAEHMQGPAYLIHYLYRRSMFFTHTKFVVRDELDLLGYYLKRDLRFDDLDKKKYEAVTDVRMPSLMNEFNRYYHSQQGIGEPDIPILLHHSTPEMKRLISALEQSGLDNRLNIAVQFLEMGDTDRRTVITAIQKIKKRYRSDRSLHDFTGQGRNWEGVIWTVVYMVGSDSAENRTTFDQFTRAQHARNPLQLCLGVFDIGDRDFALTELRLLLPPVSR